MSLRINLNSAAMTAHRQLAATDNALGKSIERLSSGYKINSAGDDPAGLVISEKLRAQVGGLNQAIKNAGDAVNMVKTAEGALSEVTRLLGTMRTLAIHAASTATNDDATLAADQSQIASAIASINKISSETQFGGKKLLDGSAGIITTVTGSAVTSADMTKAPLTANVAAAYIDVKTAAAKATMASTVDIAATPITAGKFITINGVTVTSGAGNAATITAINNVTNLTGVVASQPGNFLVLTQQSYGSANRIDVTSADATIWNSVSAAAIGVDAAAEVTSDGTTGYITNSSWASGAGTIIKDSLGNAIQLTDAAAGAVADVGAQFSVAVGSMTFQLGAFAGQTRSMNINSVSTTQLGLAAVGGGSTTSTALIDVTTTAKVQEAINVLDKAIADVSSLRSNLGSTQKNTLESAINSLSVASENIASSESSIRDTDMAAEMVEFSRNSILMQAGMAMLAQANQGPQALLRLLQ